MKKKLQKVLLMSMIALFGLSHNANAQALQWAKSMGGAYNVYAISIALDGSGNVYTTGSFEGTVDFNPGAGFYNLTSGIVSIFISKLDAFGNFVWAKAMGAVSGDGQSRSISLDASGNVYTTGSFMGTVDFDPGAGVANLTPSGIYDIFISKLDASGNFVWAKAMGGTGSESVGGSIALDGSGNVYTAGSFLGTVDFDPGAGVFNLTSAGVRDIFISKLDASGNFVWAKAMGGVVDDWCYSIALDGTGNVYTTGFIDGTADFDPGAGVFNLTSAGYEDIFISKLDASGNFVWAKAMGGTASLSVGRSISLDGSGNVYTTGCFVGTVDFDPGAGVANLTSAGINNIFISKLDASGNFVWAKAMGGTGSESVGGSIALDGSGNVYTAGSFLGTVDFDPGAGLANLTSAGYGDIFISKLDASGNFVWANAMGGSGGEESYSIALDGSGNVYATGVFSDTADFDPGAGVANLTSAGGLDIFVAKYFQNSTGINNNEYSKNLFSIYPNPSTGKFNIEFSNQQQITSVEIYNLLGESVFQKQNTNEIDLSSAAKGIYFVKVYAGEKIYTEKIIVE